jgi:hypothetical protein
MLSFGVAATRQSTRVISIVLAVAIGLIASSRFAEARTGTVHLTLAKAGIVLGVGRATGTLHFEGRNYALEVSGITAGTIGVGLVRLKGHAHHLRSAADIAGHYTVASVSAAIVGGIKTARLQHSHSAVYLQLEGPSVGFELSASLGGVTITLPEQVP